MIDVCHGLLYELLSLSVLSYDQIEDVRIKRADCSKVSQLLNYVMKSSCDKQKRFLVALYKTGQQHVNNYILANGQRSGTDIENWPLMDTREFLPFYRHQAKLVNLIDPKSGLLDEMLSIGCISRQQKERIEAGQTTYDKNEALVDVLSKRSIGDYNKFIGCLLITKQHQVVSLLAPDISGTSRPLSDKQISRLTQNHATLVELLDTKHGDLLSRLYSADCITRRQKESVESAVTRTERNNMLLDIVSRGSRSNFDKFVTCVRDSGQQQLCRLLVEDGTVAQIVVKLDGTGTRTLLYSRLAIHMKEVLQHDVKEDEERIVNEFMTLLKTSSNERRKQLYNQMCKLHEEIDLIAVNTRHSIALFYFCTTFAGLLHLNELYTSEQLQTHLCCTFRKLINCSRPGIIKTLTWNRSNHAKCFKFFCTTLNLSVFIEIYDQADRNRKQCCIRRRAAESKRIDQFPLETIERIILKATAALFEVLLPVSLQAELCAVATVCAVSRLWWRLTFREHNKRLLRMQFKRVSHPFLVSSRLLKILHMNDVWGMCEFSNKLYAAEYYSHVIKVFNISPPFSRLTDIEIPGLIASTDIVVCTETIQLYIADCEQRAIWRVNLSCYKQVDKFISTQWRPNSLSTRFRRLLISPYDGDALSIYSDDGVLLKHIKLPHYLRATHAMESTHNTYIVSHHSLPTGDTLQPEHESVSEIDINGRVVRTFNSQHNDIDSIQFHMPSYLALAGNNHVIVADHRNERIVVLTEDLQFKRVLINSLHRGPWRLYLSQRTGLLFVPTQH
jgi:hypothetical protein